MPSFGAAKTPMAKGGHAMKVTPIHGEGGEPEGEASANYAKAVEKFHAIHHKMAGHIAGLEKHLSGLRTAHSMLGEHLGISMPGKSGVDKAAPTEADEAQE